MEIGKKRLGVTQTPRTDFENKFFVKIHNWRADFISPGILFLQTTISQDVLFRQNSKRKKILAK